MIDLIGPRPFDEGYDASLSFGNSASSAPPGVPDTQGIEDGMAGKGGIGQGVPQPGGIEEGSRL
jgi:hypothetical protein